MSQFCRVRNARQQTLWLAACLLSAAAVVAQGAEIHVSTRGNDSNRGSRSSPLRHIQSAADIARPGDVITVHEGVYRERINPPCGGESDIKRITYQAARGEEVVIKGSEVVTNWSRVRGNVWKTAIANSTFGEFNPYNDIIKGDWFNPRNREHHTGAVYQNGHWLVEATSLDEVLAETPPFWLDHPGESYLLNVAWLQPGSSASRTAANAFATQQGVQIAPCSEGGHCIGFIEHGDWARYDKLDFGHKTAQVTFRAASATQGGIIELRLGSPAGELLGKCAIPDTGGWQSWATFKASIKPLSGTNDLCLLFVSAKDSGKRHPSDTRLWFASVGPSDTTIWAQLDAPDPNDGSVEINMRRAVFYPGTPGCNFITVRGFHMRHAATPWAPPTAEQIGLIGTHWSKGWIIENNVISHSVCSGIALGKHGDPWDNTSANTAAGYVQTIERGLQRGWARDTIGHHIVRNNHISHCEQAGIVGSLGAAFCTVSGNLIEDIHTRRLFTGAEMAAIKFHGAIDTLIRGNHIRRACLGLWLDWMAQGTRVSGNLFCHNDRDLFMEVNHGPFVIDNNLFLSGAGLLDVSEGGAYLHNLFMGTISSHPEPNRETPYHPAHSTRVAGLRVTRGGDCRFFNNIFIGQGARAPNAHSYGLAMYSERPYPLLTSGNVFYNGAQPYKDETGHVITGAHPLPRLSTQGHTLVFHFNAGPELEQAHARLITTSTLGNALVADLPYEDADGSILKIDRDLAGAKRPKSHPTPGPIQISSERHIARKLPLATR